MAKCHFILSKDLLETKKGLPFTEDQKKKI